ncbi:putative Calcium-dependent protein kinase 15 [Paratrimastix pyriformis]|uniref:Calcium-dependent protein kinase 15 n=1 Tax=Paratrimastix pyriformis TaxID=342808 RepID=A0ABQ8UPA7_9EUKA|nr:putative Calcium-dependent protein kinase 15 [Paratrimastix pyriformis]
MPLPVVDRDPNAYDKEKLPAARQRAAGHGLADPLQAEAVRYVASQARPLQSQAFPFGPVKTFVDHSVRSSSLCGARQSAHVAAAPIIVHFHADRILGVLLNDTHLRNQFDTGTSCGYLNNQVRVEWEDTLFNKIYTKSCSGFDRVKYGGPHRPRRLPRASRPSPAPSCAHHSPPAGAEYPATVLRTPSGLLAWATVLNIVNDPCGVKCCSQYGESYLLLRNVRLRTSFANEDTGGGEHELASCEYYCHVLNRFSDPELVAVLEEVQIHGEIRLDRDVEAVFLAQRHKDHGGLPVAEFGRKKGCPIPLPSLATPDPIRLLHSPRRQAAAVCGGPAGFRHHPEYFSLGGARPPLGL